MMSTFEMRSLPTKNLGEKLLLGIWLAGAVACIAKDDELVQRLSFFQENSIPKLVAEYWQILGTSIGMAIFLGGGLLARAEVRGRIFVTFARCLAVAAVSAQTLKYLIGRTRPHWAHSPTEFSGPSAVLDASLRPIADSMPSGHTTIAFAMAIALSWRWPNLKPLWISLAVGVAISRVVLGYHFPSDVILGSWLGATTATIALHKMKRFSVTAISANGITSTDFG